MERQMVLPIENMAFHRLIRGGAKCTCSTLIPPEILPTTHYAKAAKLQLVTGSATLFSRARATVGEEDSWKRLTSNQMMVLPQKELPISATGTFNYSKPAEKRKICNISSIKT